MESLAKRGLNVLVVEDDAVVRKVIHSILRRMGVTQVQLAENGKEALACFYGDSGHYDVIISDWDMPEMDGLEFLTRVREKKPDFPFMMLTGRSEAEAVKAAKLAAVSAYVVKPFNARDLQTKMVTLIEQILGTGPAEEKQKVIEVI